jgi:hypothetical protein
VSEIPNPDNWNIYASVGYNHQREMGLKGIYEALFYTNLNTGELIPWQGESYTYNADFTQVTLKLREDKLDGFKAAAPTPSPKLEPTPKPTPAPKLSPTPKPTPAPKPAPLCGFDSRPSASRR